MVGGMTRVSGFVWTRLADVQQEMNGLLGFEPPFVMADCGEDVNNVTFSASRVSARTKCRIRPEPLT